MLPRHRTIANRLLKAIFDTANAWMQYNTVNFGSEKLSRVRVRASSPKGVVLQIRLDKIIGPLLAEVHIPAGTGWKTIDAGVIKHPKGIHNIVVRLRNNGTVELDWIQFKK